MKGHSSKSFVYSTYRDERGIVLAVVLMFLAILGAIGSAAVMMTRAEIKTSDNYKDSEEIFSAEALLPLIHILGLGSDHGNKKDLGRDGGEPAGHRFAAKWILAGTKN